MDQLLKEIRLVLYLFQWVLLLAFFFFLMDAPSPNYRFSAITLGICGVYVIILGYALPRRSWFLLGMVDLGIALFFIAQTGTWNSPFMLYAYTSMLWLTAVLRLKQVLFVFTLFILAVFVLTLWFPTEVMLPKTQHDNLSILLDMMIWASLTFWVVALLKMGKKLYARCFQVYLFLRKVSSAPSINICEVTEQMLRRVFRTEQAYLCLYQERETEGDWKRDYFLQCLLDAGAEDWNRLAILKLDDYTGREDTYACSPLRLDDEAWGCLIFAIPPKQEISKAERLMLRVISTVICQQGKQNRLHYEMAQSLHEEMRKKLAQDMHDGLAQQLFFLSAQLFQLKQSLPSEVKETAAERLGQIEERIQWCHKEVRSTITHLREFRESQQISEAIEQLLRRMTAGTDLQVRFTSKVRVLEEDLPILDAIYRMVEEATANALKHAYAHFLDVSVEASSVQVKVRVKDDGIGFCPEEKRKKNQYGVMGMKERISQVGGTFQIRSKPEEGTEIVAIIPRKGVDMWIG
ncbi:sensor histidine kinase [Brevibacillus sp. AY1]|uniref:sensor histidine kinase n=1 Tax=Brevibacillus sp. AY1 TaxID=2807621 RepID=UPI002458B4CC|nr:sensor histidine kinase [Brevibacillus sp. AY1]MDH4617823.1 sensor histidine kinase [Brevibacillus sp. AY1]